MAMIVDVRGEICPYPATAAVEAMKKAKDGESIEVIIDHAPALETVPWQAQRAGWDAEIEEISDAEWKITLTRKVAARR